MIKIDLRFWMAGPTFDKLRKAAVAYWDAVEEWMKWPLNQLDAMSCSLPVLNLLAFARDIQRFSDEPIELYRSRVALAYVNARDAGSKQGFEKIFQRLGIGYIETSERVDPVDWDVVLLRISENQLASNIELINRIIHKYGRTCRRYLLETITPLSVVVEADATGHVWSFDTAIQQIEPWKADLGIDSRPAGHSWNLDIAGV